MLGLVRTLISLFFVSTLVWCSFTVPLGGRTFAEHIDRIGQTNEARELLRGTRARITPILEEAKHRLLGEYVEAPTFQPASPLKAPGHPKAAGPSDANTLASARPMPAAPASPERSAALPERRPSTAASARLPGVERRRGTLPAAHLARP